MSVLIDTNVAIHLRDRDEATIARLSRLASRPFLSIISRIELAGGVAARPHLADRLQRGNDELLASMTLVPFDLPEAEAYAAILVATGYSRRRTLDRLIAATAIANGLTLVTINGDDFRDIPGLALESWALPVR